MAKKLQSGFSVLTLLGTPFFYAPLCVVFAVFDFAASVRLAMALAVVEVFCGILKFIYPKERPVPLPRKTFYQRYEAGSFPSVHSARTAAMAVFFSLQYPHWSVAAVGVLALLVVGYSRIFLQKHYLVDVVAGALIGAAFGVLFA